MWMRCAALAWLVSLVAGCHLLLGHDPGAAAPDRGATPDGPRPDVARADTRADARPDQRPLPDAYEEPPPPPSGCPEAGSWCWVHPRPHGNRFHAVWIDPTGKEAFAVGDQGTVAHATLGQPWTEMASGTTAALRGVSGLSATNVVAVGDDGLILRYDGMTWSAIPGPAAGKTLRAVHGEAGQLIAVGDEGTVISSKDGKVWQTFVPKLDDPKAVNLSLRAVGHESGLVAVGGDSGQVFTLPPVAVTWAPHELPGKPTVRGLAVKDGTVVAVGDGGFVRAYDGTAWQPLPGASESLHGVARGEDAQGYPIAVAVGKGSFLRIDLAKLTSQGSPTGMRDARAVALRAAALVVAGGGGAIWSGDDSGPTKRELPASLVTEEDLNGIWPKASALFAVGGKETILRLGGGAIQAESAPFPTLGLTLHAIGSAGTSAPLVAVGGKGTILHRDPGGGWAQQPIKGEVSADLFAVGGSSGYDLWAVGAPATKDQPPVIVHFDGAAWSAVGAPPGTPKTLTGVWAGAGVAYAVGPGIVLERKTGDWVAASLPQAYWADGLRAVWGRGPAEVHAVGKSVLLFDGSGWSQPTGLPSPARAIHGRSSGPVIAVGEAGLVARNDGAGWTQTRVTGNNLHAVWTGGPGVWVVGEAGTILYYRDK
jgi:hypothetical protein